jgi:hypothetical protein
MRLDPSHAFLKRLAGSGVGGPLEWLGRRGLGAQSYRVLRFDLYGRGWSECDGAPHTAAHFVGQLAELLFELSGSPLLAHGAPARYTASVSSPGRPP